MLELLKQMENVVVIKKSQLITIKGGTLDGGQPECNNNSSNNTKCSHV